MTTTVTHLTSSVSPRIGCVFQSLSALAKNYLSNRIRQPPRHPATSTPVPAVPPVPTAASRPTLETELTISGVDLVDIVNV